MESLTIIPRERITEDIIAGRFETENKARAVATSLVDFVSENDIFIFFNNQPAAHDSDSVPADQDAAESAAKCATAGAASGGVSAGVVGTIVGGPAVGAIAASLIITLS